MNTFFLSENPIEEMLLNERGFEAEEIDIVIEMCRDEPEAMENSYRRFSDEGWR